MRSTTLTLLPLLASAVSAFGPNFVLPLSRSIRLDGQELRLSPSAMVAMKNGAAKRCRNDLFSGLFMSNDDGDSDDSLKPIEIQEQKYLGLSEQGSEKDMVYIISYLPGTAEEGFHTTEYPLGSERQVMLAFESLDEVNYFSQMLRDEPTWGMDPVPTPAPLDQILSAVKEAGMMIAIVPE